MNRQSERNYHEGQARTSRRSVLKTAAAGATAVAISPFMFNIARGASDTVRVGLPVPLTGPYGTEAREQARCAQIALDEFNAAGGLNGRIAELLVRYDKLTPGEASTRTQELIEKDKLHFVCGP